MASVFETFEAPAEGAPLSSVYQQFMRINVPAGVEATSAWIGEIQPFSSNGCARAFLENVESNRTIWVWSGNIREEKSRQRHWANPLLVNMKLPCRVLVLLQQAPAHPRSYLLSPNFPEHYSWVHPHPRFDQTIQFEARKVPGLCIYSAAEFQFDPNDNPINQYLDQLTIYLAKHLIWLRTRELVRGIPPHGQIVRSLQPGEELMDDKPVKVQSPSSQGAIEYWRGHWPGSTATSFNPQTHFLHIAGHSTAQCFAVFVAKSRRAGSHQTTSGLSRIRSGKNCRPYYFAEDDRTKATVESADLDDLSPSSIHWGIRQHNRKFGLDGQMWESPSDFLTHIGLIENPAPCSIPQSPRISLAGILLFGTDAAIRRICPGLETIVISRLGEKRIRTNIIESYRQLLGSRTALLNSLCPQVPERCIKEILMNAYVHRDYRVSSPVVIRAMDDVVEFENPGGLCTGLSSESLLHCTPVYRNFLVAEASRFLGLCDKVGRGINAVYQGVLEQGLGFPVFEDHGSQFMTRISLAGNRDFQEFLKCRSQSLSLLEEIIVLRFLFDRESASYRELCEVMQRGHSSGHKILSDMVRKSMIVPDSSLNLTWKLCPIVRSDIENIFNKNQYEIGFPDLFAEQKLDS